MTLRDLRERAGLTQEQLAAKAGLTHSTIYKLETGRAKRPGYTTMERLAAVLGVRPDEIHLTTRTEYKITPFTRLLGYGSGPGNAPAPNYPNEQGDYTAIQKVRGEARRRNPDESLKEVLFYDRYPLIQWAPIEENVASAWEDDVDVGRILDTLAAGTRIRIRVAPRLSRIDVR